MTAVRTALQKLLDSIHYDQFGDKITGQGGHGGLISDDTMRAWHEGHAALLKDDKNDR